MAHFIQAVTVPWYNACADYAVTLACGLRALGHRVTVAGGSGSPAVARARDLGFEALERPGSASWNPLELVRLVKTYRSYVRDHGVAAVNVHHGRDHLLWAAAMRGTGIPLVRTSGNQIPPKIHPGTRRLLRHHTAGIIASCGAVRKFYADGFGINPERIPVINGGVDASFFTPHNPREALRSALGIPGEAFVFGIIGRYSPVKGHRYFFEAAEEVSLVSPDAWFVVAGWNAQLNGEDMRAMAERAGIIERTRFTGRQNDIRDLIGSIDAGVIASIGSETVCRIAMEYMAMGIPVIAAGTNVIPEIIRDGETGWIVPRGDSGAMAVAMGRLLASREGAHALGLNGRDRVEREFSLERFAEKTLDAYRSMSIHV
jgi:glycosyltransferase involved in cell wall biosynthesis